mgnify:CR=1 FL=1
MLDQLTSAVSPEVRGLLEKALEKREIEIVAGRTTTVGLTLNHVLPTKGLISADFHVHSVRSVDSETPTVCFSTARAVTLILPRLRPPSSIW